MKRLIFSILVLGLFCAKANCFVNDDDYEFSAITSPGIISRVQSAQNSASGLSNVKAFSSANTAGNMIVIGLAVGDNSNASITSIVDTNLNTYTIAISSLALASGGVATRSAIYYAKAIAGGANTVTVTFGAGTNFSTIFIAEYSGLNASSPFVVGSSGTGITGDTSDPSIPSMATNGIDNLVLGIYSDTTGSNNTITAGTNFTIVQKQETAATGVLGALEDRGVGPQLGDGSYQPTFTRSNHNPEWGMVGAIFKP